MPENLEDTKMAQKLYRVYEWDGRREIELLITPDEQMAQKAAQEFRCAGEGHIEYEEVECTPLMALELTAVNP